MSISVPTSVETVKNLQKRAIEEKARKHQLTIDVFAPIRDAHNELVDAGAYVHLPQAAKKYLYSLDKDVIKITYSVPYDDRHKHFLSFEMSPETTPARLKISSDVAVLRPIFKEVRYYTNCQDKEEYLQNALDFYLEMMSVIIRFPES